MLKNEYSQMEVMYGLINMQAELGMVPNVLLDVQGVDPPTKIHIVADAPGNPINFEVTECEVHDSQIADNLILKVGASGSFIADKYDAESIKEKLRIAGIIPLIPRRCTSQKTNVEFDSHLYRLRHLVENCWLD